MCTRSKEVNQVDILACTKVSFISNTYMKKGNISKGTQNYQRETTQQIKQTTTTTTNTVPHRLVIRMGSRKPNDSLGMLVDPATAGDVFLEEARRPLRVGEFSLLEATPLPLLDDVLLVGGRLHVACTDRSADGPPQPADQSRPWRRAGPKAPYQLLNTFRTRNNAPHGLPHRQT